MVNVLSVVGISFLSRVGTDCAFAVSIRCVLFCMQKSAAILSDVEAAST